MSTSTTGISWTDRTWNCVRGCSVISPGCTNCYAMRMAWRFRYKSSFAGEASLIMAGGGTPEDGPFADLTRITTHGPVWTGKVQIIESALEEPMTWRKPARIFANSMSDLFHEGVSDDFIDAVFGVMAYCSHHTFQILTKRPERMLQFITRVRERAGNRFLTPALLGHAACFVKSERASDKLNAEANHRAGQDVWPLPNVHLGVSVENQATADDRIPILLQIPAAVRFLSCEPLLEDIELSDRCRHYLSGLRYGDRRVDWVIVGGESGPGARLCEVEWIRSLVGQCHTANVRCFVKQLGARSVIERIDEHHWREQRFVGDRAISDPAHFPEGFPQEFPE